MIQFSTPAQITLLITIHALFLMAGKADGGFKSGWMCRKASDYVAVVLQFSSNTEWRWFGVLLCHRAGGSLGHGLQGQCSRHLWQPIRSTNRGLAGVENLGCADVENLGGAHVRNLGGAHVRNLGGADVRRGVVARNVRNLGTAYVKNLGMSEISGQMSEISGGQTSKILGLHTSEILGSHASKISGLHMQKSWGCTCKNLEGAYAEIS